jgi:hypothetical protein
MTRHVSTIKAVNRLEGNSFIVSARGTRGANFARLAGHTVHVLIDHRRQ